ncbi:unnamed protein product [Acanthosepion pharaonis]|uniref:Uncharacterized protein n=1 Tax=Acanthosepion pharaonis TaxID=158019 RepID=A0A812E258_ACAPH|nr:unnamed protein product [Sepia pharaonis]
MDPANSLTYLKTTLSSEMFLNRYFYSVSLFLSSRPNLLFLSFTFSSLKFLRIYSSILSLMFYRLSLSPSLHLIFPCIHSFYIFLIHLPSIFIIFLTTTFFYFPPLFSTLLLLSPLSLFPNSFWFFSFLSHFISPVCNSFLSFFLLFLSQLFSFISTFSFTLVYMQLATSIFFISLPFSFFQFDYSFFLSLFLSSFLLRRQISSNEIEAYLFIP